MVCGHCLVTVTVLCHRRWQRPRKGLGTNKTDVNMVLDVHRNHREGERGGGGAGGMGGGGVLRETFRYTVTTRMTPALRWAVMRAILMFH